LPFHRGVVVEIAEVFKKMTSSTFLDRNKTLAANSLPVDQQQQSVTLSESKIDRLPI